MEKFGYRNAAYLLGGSIIGGTGSVPLLWGGASGDFLLMSLKFGGLLLSAACTAAATVYGKYLMEKWVNRKKLKP